MLKKLFLCSLIGKIMNHAHRILLLGSGGRESAIAWKLHESPYCTTLFCAPGNAGTAQYGVNIDIQPTEFDKIKALCIEQNISILFPGNEDPLVAGIWDFFKNDSVLKHIIVAGPSQAAAQLEGSKAFAKKFMQRHNIPTAAYRAFGKENFEEGLAYLQSQSMPIVLKADGLAAGKGVVIAESNEEAAQAFTAMLQDNQFGDAGNTVVVEQFLSGIELSVFAMTDGAHYVVLPEAKDYKRIGEGDTGPNTGGMGAISPVPFADQDFMTKVNDRIIAPTVNGLKEEGLAYQGFLFFGLIKVGSDPFVIEYNCRLGDPETEVVLPRLKNDLVELIRLMNEKQLDSVEIEHHELAAAAVMLVSEGYPGSYAKGKTITGIDRTSNSLIFLAGAQDDGEGSVTTSGGRVMAVTSYGVNLQEALAQSYANVDILAYDGKAFRKDIGWEFL